MTNLPFAQLDIELICEVDEQWSFVGKRFTQRIERTNLTLRSRIKRLVRRTIGFSKSEEMHDKVIGTFIEREFYGLFNGLATLPYITPRC